MLQIIRYPDPFLREVSEPVSQINDEIRALAREMIETMYASRGLGLAAPQVRVHKRLVIVDLDHEKHDPRVMINPRIIRRGKTKETGVEGCLSLPGVEAKVTRPAEVTLEAMNLEGETIEYQGTGLTAKAFQHEIDHLDGILFIDKVSMAAKLAIRSELKRLETSYEEGNDG